MTETMVNFEAVEDGIIEALRAEVTYLRTVETYAGQLEDELGMLPDGLPAAYVVYGGSAYEWVDGPTHAEALEFSIIVVAGNLRSRQAARKDVRGAYDALGDVARALTNKSLDLSIERLRPLRAALLFVNGTTAAYEMVFGTSIDGTYNY